MPNPTISDVHVNAPLTNISVAFMQNSDSFIANKVFPNIPVQKQSDRYYTYDRGDWNRNQAVLRAPGAESAGGGYKIDNTPTYYAPVVSIHKDVPDQIRANSDAVLDPDREATNWVTQQLMIYRESDFVTNFLGTSIWTTDIAGVSGSPSSGQVKQWSDYTASDPLLDVRAGMTVVQESTAFRPNTLVLGQKVWDKLVDHPDIIDRVKYGQTAGKPAMVTKEAVAQILELDRIMVASSIVNTAAEGASNSHSFQVGKVALLAYVTPAPGLMTPTAGYTFSWNGYMGATAFGSAISKFRMQHLKSDRVEGEMAYALKKVSADLGYFFNDIIA